ncbi:MAG TPA: hypothetical protein VGG85_09735 [Terracidiphilus sp.]|jgi:hypothetical protein
MESLEGNIRFAARLLAKNSGVTLPIILTLAIAIGANTAIFTVTDALLLRPFPYRDSGQLLLGVALLSGYLPARHAMGADPNDAIK